MQRFLGLVVLSLACVACTREVRLLDLSDGELLTGSTTLWNQSVMITLPSGEVVEGGFSPLSNVRIGEDSLFHQVNLGAMFGGQVSGRFHGYAYLTGKEGTIVEIVFASDWTSRGFGFARTNLGREYRVSF